MAIRLQSSLGRLHQDISEVYSKDMTELVLAKVVAVHYNTGTCDVVTSNGDYYCDSNSGKNAPFIPQYMAGFDTDTGKAWGSIRPIAIGTWVLLGFMNKLKSRPVILNIFPDIYESYKNVFVEDTPLSEKIAGYERREALKSLNVYPSMAYSKLDGEGNIEFSHPSKSFLAIYNENADSQNALTDVHNGFDHMHLSERDKQNGEVLETGFEEAKASSKALFVHRSDFDDSTTTWTKFFLDVDGLFRLTRDNNDEKLTYMELDKEGTFSVKRLMDNPFIDESKQYNSISLDKDGNAFFKHSNNDVDSIMGITSQSEIYMEHASGSKLIMDKDLYLETKGEIVSKSLQEFVKKYHVIVSDTEPEFPENHLVWIDISD